MRRVLLLSGCITLCLPALAGEDLKKELTATYAAITKAFNAHDIEAYSKFLAPDYTLRAGKETFNHEKVISEMKKQMKELGKVNWTRKVTQASRKGNIVTALVVGELKATVKKDNVDHQLELDITSQDVWMHKKGSWILKSTTVKSGVTKVDGKVVKQGG